MALERESRWGGDRYGGVGTGTVVWYGRGAGEVGREQIHLVRGQAEVGFCLSPVRACPRFEALDAGGLMWLAGSQDRGLWGHAACGDRQRSGGAGRGSGRLGDGQRPVLPVPGLDMALERAARRGGDWYRHLVGLLGTGRGRFALWGQAEVRGGWLRFGVAWGQAEAGFACPRSSLSSARGFGRGWVGLAWGPGEILVRGQAEAGFCLSPD